MAQDGVQLTQGGVKMSHDGRKMAQDESRWPQDGSRWLQDGLKMGQDGLKMGQDGLKMARPRAMNGENVKIPLIKVQIRVCNVHHAQQRSRFSEKMIQKWSRGRTCDAKFQFRRDESDPN